MIIFTEQNNQSAEYEVTVSGSIREVVHDDQGGEEYTIRGDTISGSVWGASYDKFTFDGEVESIDTNHPEVLEIYSNYQRYL